MGVCVCACVCISHERLLRCSNAFVALFASLAAFQARRTLNSLRNAKLIFFIFFRKFSLDLS